MDCVVCNQIKHPKDPVTWDAGIWLSAQHLECLDHAMTLPSIIITILANYLSSAFIFNYKMGTNSTNSTHLIRLL